MSQQLKVLCRTKSPEVVVLVVALANKLSGVMTEYLVCDRGYNFSFSFARDTFGEQFRKAIALYPEVIEVMP